MIRARLSAAVLVTLAAAACAPPLPPPPVPTARAEAPRKELAREFVGLLEARRYEDAHGWLDARTAADVSPSRLERDWLSVRGEAGRFVAIPEVHEQATGRRSIVWATVEFEKGSTVVTIHFDAATRVPGLWFGELVATWRPPPYSDPAAIEERDLEVGVRPKLAATLTRPKAGGPFPLAILVHGSGPGNRDESNKGTRVFKDIAFGLASRGVAVLRYEKRTRELPGTLPKAFTYDHETILDARAAVADARELPEIDRARVFVVGHSQGAGLAPRIAAGVEGLAGIVLLAGPTRRIDKIHSDQTIYLGHVEGLSERTIRAIIERDAEAFAAARKPGPPDEIFPVGGAKLPRSYLVDQLTYEPASAARALTLPILVLQGDRDYQVTAADDYVGWQRALAGRPNVAMRLYPGLNHLFVYGTAPSVPAEYDRAAHADAKVVADVASWILSSALPP